MATSFQVFALLPFLFTVVAGEDACPAGASCTTVGDEVNATLNLMQIGFSLQPGTAGPDDEGKPAPGPGKTCPGAGQARVWYACKGGKTSAPTDDQAVSGVQVGSQMCCTEEIGFACLCCTDFTEGLDFNRCGSMMLDAGQKPKGAPGALASDVPDDDSNVSLTEAEKTAVFVCSKDKATGGAPKNGTVTEPVKCTGREFTLAELKGSKEKNLAPGQILFDQRILFLIAQGLPANAIPTCKGTIKDKCPDDTPLKGKDPNSAGQETLDELKSHEEMSQMSKDDLQLLGVSRARPVKASLHLE